jgi:adenine-specific DNA-methyltransferase
MPKNDYCNWDRDKLIKECERLLNVKKYGLVWESDKHPEKVVEDCKNHLPVLREVEDKAINQAPNEPTNILIEGDNYHSLSVLNYTHRGKVDVIYIDPPYNTGNKDFKYNDQWVDQEDAYRHSKWLCFMSKRLELAKNLLSKSGVIFMSIDDGEQAQLKMLANEIFGEENFVACIIWEKKFSPANDAKWFSDNHDYILCYAKNKPIWQPTLLPRTDKMNARYSNPDNDKRGVWMSSDISVRTYSKATDYPVKMPNGETINPPKGRCWSISKEKFEELLADNRIYTGGKVPRLKRFLCDVKQGMTPLTIWKYTEVGHNQTATQELKKIFGGQSSFSSPKPTSLIKQVLRVATNKKSAVICDFFAGSGTTAQAVLELNKEDGGNRQFILATNNELNGEEKKLQEQGLSEEEIQKHGIAQKITYPRIKKVIEGYTDVGGIPANLKYYRTAFVETTSVDPTDKEKWEITHKATEMLCLRENTFDEVNQGNNFVIYKGVDKKHTGIIFDYNAIADFCEAIKDIDGKFSVYVFSYSDETFDKDFEAVKNKVKLSPIPEAILKVYRRIFR